MTQSISNLVASQDDSRDIIWSPQPRMLGDFISVRKWAGDRKDQRDVGSCVPHAILNGCEVFTDRALAAKRFSPQFVYDVAGELDGLQGLPGRTLRSGCKVVQKFGVCLETEYPYRNTEETLTPSAETFALAATHKLAQYQLLDTSQGWQTTAALIRLALAAEYPVVIAMRVGQRLYDITGPLAQQQYATVSASFNPYIGNHAMVIQEWDWNGYMGFAAENQWKKTPAGEPWGDDGFVRLGPEMLIDCFEARVLIAFDGRYTDEQIADYVLVLIARAGSLDAAAPEIWAAIKRYNIAFEQVERAMRWPAGSIEAYARQHGWIT